MKQERYHDAYSDLELDYKALKVIPPELLAKEVGLYQTKWWDYRLIHPTRATYLFADAYEKAYRVVYGIRFDKYEARTVRVYGNRDVMQDTTEKVVDLWKARQLADELGIPYQIFCYQGLDASERFGWPNLARPKELIQEGVVAHINEHWVARNLQMKERPTSEFYKDENFVGHPYQVQWREHQKLYRQIVNHD